MREVVNFFDDLFKVFSKGFYILIILIGILLIRECMELFWWDYLIVSEFSLFCDGSRIFLLNRMLGKRDLKYKKLLL